MYPSTSYRIGVRSDVVALCGTDILNRCFCGGKVKGDVRYMLLGRWCVVLDAVGGGVFRR